VSFEAGETIFAAGDPPLAAGNACFAAGDPGFAGGKACFPAGIGGFAPDDPCLAADDADFDVGDDALDGGGGSFFLTMVSPQRRSDGSTPRAASNAPRRLSAAASIWRTRSRVTPICLPIASRVSGSPPPSPKRWVTTRRS